MRTNIRLKLDCAERVLEFHRRHDTQAPSTLEAVAHLRRLLAEATALIEQRQFARLMIAAALRERDAGVCVIRARLALLVRLARAAAARERVPALRLKVCQTNGPVPLFRATRESIAVARTHQVTLVRCGMPEGMLEDLESSLEACQAAHERRDKALASLTDAGLQLDAVARETLPTIRHLDALNRMSLAGDPERLAEWQEARSVAWRRAS